MTDTLTRLRTLAAIHEAIERKCFYLVSGDHALAAARGELAGPHDIELLCFRADAQTVRRALAEVGIALADAGGLGCVHEMADARERVTVRLLDPAPENCFEIGLDGLPPRRLPLHAIAPRNVTLERVTFPIPQEGFLRLLRPGDGHRDPEGRA